MGQGLAAPRIIFANDPTTNIVFANDTPGGLGRRVLSDKPQNAYVEIMDVQEDNRGTLVTYSTQWYSVLNCRDFLAVWTDAGSGDLLGYSRVEVDDLGYFNLASGTCTKEVKTRLETSSNREVQVQLWQLQGNTVDDVLNGSAVGYATMSRAFYLDESTSVGGQDSDTVADTIEDSTAALASAIFSPIATWATVGLALYVGWTNRDAIANALR